MKFFINSGKYVGYILNVLYFIAFVKITSSFFFNEYVPFFFKSPYFTVPLLICILIFILIKKKL